MIERFKVHKVGKECEKEVYTALNYNGYSQDIVIEKGNIREVEQLKKYALAFELDIIKRNYTVTAKKRDWCRYYHRGTLRHKPYEFDRIFIDIDSPYSEHSTRLEAILQGLGLSYTLVQSASNNIHLYIHTRRVSSERIYRRCSAELGRYFIKHGIPVDKSSYSPRQGVYLEGFRILKKHGRSSRVRKIYKAQELLTAPKVIRRVRGYSIRYAMRVIQRELRGSRHINMQALSLRYGIPHSTLQRALQRLTEHGALRYINMGCKGVRVVSVDREVMNRSIAYQRTSRQYWLRVIEGTWRVIEPLSELLQYTKRMFCGSGVVCGVFTPVGTLHGVFDRTRGSPEHSSYGAQRITKGTRNKVLYTTLIKARYQGKTADQIREIAYMLHERMENRLTFKINEVEAVIRWAVKAELRYG